MVWMETRNVYRIALSTLLYPSPARSILSYSLLLYHTGAEAVLLCVRKRSRCVSCKLNSKATLRTPSMLGVCLTKNTPVAY